MPKITIVFLIYDLGLGGAEIQIILHAIRFIKMGHCVQIVYFSSRTRDVLTRFESADIEQIKFIDMSNLTVLNFKRKIKDLFRNLYSPRTIIHAHMWKANIISRLIGYFVSVPIINSIHAVSEGKFLVPLLYHINKKSVAFISTVSYEAKQNLELIAGLKNIEIKVFDNILDPTYYRMDNDQISCFNKEYKILFVGRLVSDKNIITLLNAFAMVTNEFENISLTIVGDGPLHDIILSRITQLKLETKVRIISTASPIKLIRESNLLVLPSHSEAFGLVLLEAAACNTDIICSNNVPSKELFVDNISSFDAVRPEEIKNLIVAKLVNPTPESILNTRRDCVLQRYSDKRVCDIWQNEYFTLLGEDL